jgi:ABC-2 type transport system ATP-binding protein
MRCSDGIKAYNLVKRFRGRTVVHGVSLSVEPGTVYALVGPNGAGKTTTLRMLVGIYQPDEGHVEVCGHRLDRDPAARRFLAYLPENAGIYPRLTGFEHLRFYASLYLGPDSVDDVVDRAARISGLGRDLYRKAGEYSRGMRRRLLLALVLALNTPIVVLDEPTSGLDVQSAVTIRRLIRAAAEEGRAVLMTSHNMLEVERVADRVAFMVSGRIVAEGPPQELVSRFEAGDLEEAFVKAAEVAAR